MFTVTIAISTELRVGRGMAQFWKPGTDKPRLLDDEEGGVLFFSSSLSSSSSGYIFSSFIKYLYLLLNYILKGTPILYAFLCLYLCLFLDMGMRVLRNRGRDCQCTSTVPHFFIWWRHMLLLSLLARLEVAKPLRFPRLFCFLNFILLLLFLGFVWLSVMMR